MVQVLHVEVARNPASHLKTADVLKLLQDTIGALKNPVSEFSLDGAKYTHLKDHVKSISFCSGGNTLKTLRSNSSNKIMKPRNSSYKPHDKIEYHIFKLNEEGQSTEFIDDDEDDGQSPASYHTILPSEALYDLWDSLIFKSDVKDKLMDYIRTTVMYSEKKVNDSLICWNKVILLYGPPGTGKTSLCKALAQKASIRLGSRYDYGQLIEINSHSLFSKWFSESGKLVMKMFERIQELIEDTHSIVFLLIDEIESLAKNRLTHDPTRDPADSVRAVNALLTQIDRIKKYPNVVILSTSNIVGSIDVALVDRADMKLFIGNPPSEIIYEILASSVNELIRVGIISVEEDILIPQTHREIQKTDSSYPFARKLVDIAKASLHLSGRTLRKIPFLTHVRHVTSDSCTLHAFLDGMFAAVEDEKRAVTELDKHSTNGSVGKNPEKFKNIHTESQLANSLLQVKASKPVEDDTTTEDVPPPARGPGRPAGRRQQIRHHGKILSDSSIIKKTARESFVPESDFALKQVDDTDEIQVLNHPNTPIQVHERRRCKASEEDPLTDPLRLKSGVKQIGLKRRGNSVEMVGDAKSKPKVETLYKVMNKVGNSTEDSLCLTRNRLKTSTSSASEQSSSSKGIRLRNTKVVHPRTTDDEDGEGDFDDDCASTESDEEKPQDVDALAVSSTRSLNSPKFAWKDEMKRMKECYIDLSNSICTPEDVLGYLAKRNNAKSKDSGNGKSVNQPSSVPEKLHSVSITKEDSSSQATPVVKATTDLPSVSQAAGVTAVHVLKSGEAVKASNSEVSRLKFSPPGPKSRKLQLSSVKKISSEALKTVTSEDRTIPQVKNPKQWVTHPLESHSKVAKPVGEVNQHESQNSKTIKPVGDASNPVESQSKATRPSRETTPILKTTRPSRETTPILKTTRPSRETTPSTKSSRETTPTPKITRSTGERTPKSSRESTPTPKMTRPTGETNPTPKTIKSVDSAVAQTGMAQPPATIPRFQLPKPILLKIEHEACCLGIATSVETSEVLPKQQITKNLSKTPTKLENGKNTKMNGGSAYLKSSLPNPTPSVSNITLNPSPSLTQKSATRATAVSSAKTPTVQMMTGTSELRKDLSAVNKSGITGASVNVVTNGKANSKVVSTPLPGRPALSEIRKSSTYSRPGPLRSKIGALRSPEIIVLDGEKEISAHRDRNLIGPTHLLSKSLPPAYVTKKMNGPIPKQTELKNRIIPTNNYEHPPAAPPKSKGRMFCCDLCQVTFYFKRELTAHNLQNHTTPFTGKCSACKKQFTKPSSLKAHEKQCKKKHSEQASKPKVFISFGPMQMPDYHADSLNEVPLQTMSRKDDELAPKRTKFSCDECSEVFDNEKAMTKHKIVHSDERPYECEHCPKTFKRKSSKNFHVQITHTNSPDESYACTVCGMIFDSETEVANHENSTHFNQNTPSFDVPETPLSQATTESSSVSSVNNSDCDQPSVFCENPFSDSVMDSLTNHHASHNSHHNSYHPPSHHVGGVGGSTDFPLEYQNCTICGECFLHEYELIQHQQSFHQPPTPIMAPPASHDVSLFLHENVPVPDAETVIEVETTEEFLNFLSAF